MTPQSSIEALLASLCCSSSSSSRPLFLFPPLREEEAAAGVEAADEAASVTGRENDSRSLGCRWILYPPAEEDEVDEDDWGDVDDTIKPMDSVSQVFASTDNRSHTSEPTQIKMSPPLQFPPKSAVYTPPSHHPPQPPPPAQYPPPPPPPPPPPIRSTGYYS